MSRQPKKPGKPPQHRPLKGVRDWWDIFEETESTSERSAAIVASAFVENNLVLAILVRLRTLDDEDQKFIFDNEHAALRDFSAKIDIGYALNLYDKNVREDLHRIRKIRNKFAHVLKVKTFDNAEVSRYCDDLVGADKLDLPTGKTKRSRKERFLDLSHHFATRFSYDCRDKHRPPSSLNRIGADY